MKFSIEKSEFLKGLGRIQAIVEKRTSMPILANVLLQATKEGEEGEIQLAATDLEVGIRGVHTANVEEAGGLTVLAKKLYEIVRELPDETIQVYDDTWNVLFLKALTDIHVKLAEYKMSLMLEASTEGTPVTRPLMLHYPDCEAARKVTD